VGEILWEIPAGKLDAGESPLDCAARELQEETGYTASRWTELVSFYTTPGFTDERITLYRAEGLTARSQPDDNEISAIRSVSSADARRMVASGEIVDAKTILAIGRLE